MTRLSSPQRAVLEAMRDGWRGQEIPLHIGLVDLKTKHARHACSVSTLKKSISIATFRALLRAGYISQQSAHPDYYHITKAGLEALNDK